MQAQRVYVKYLLVGKPAADGVRDALTHHARWQLFLMERGLGVLVIWLVIYLVWWIMHEEIEAPSKLRDRYAPEKYLKSSFGHFL